MTKRKQQVAPGWQALFLTAFARSGNILASCRAANVARRTVYAAKETDDAFRAAMVDAREDAVDILEAVAFKRAQEGKSDYLLWRLLQSNRRSLYGDRVALTSSGDGPAEVILRVVYEDEVPELLPGRGGLREVVG